MKIGPEVEAQLELHKKKIQEEYGKPVADLAGQIMAQMMLAVCVNSGLRGINESKVLDAIFKTIRFMDDYSSEYMETKRKAKNN